MNNYWLENLLSNPREFIDGFYKQGKYYKKIKDWDRNNKNRKNPRTYYVFTLDEEDAKRNATFSTFEFGIKEHMMRRGYILKAASFLPMNPLKESMLKLAGIQMGENVFIAPEVTFDPVLRGWTRFQEGCSVGWGCRFFNHLFEENGRVILGYINIDKEVSIGGFVSVSPGVTVHKKANIGAEVKIGPGATIGENAKIGACSLISSFITIGEGAEVAFGSMVNESVKPYCKVQGNPAKIIEERINKPKLDLIINPKLEKDNRAM